MLRSRFAPTPNYVLAPEDQGGTIGSIAVDQRRDVARENRETEAPTEGAPTATSRSETVGAGEVRNGAVLPEQNDSNAADGHAIQSAQESWRQDLAGADKSVRKMLDRFDSPAALAKAYKELTAKLSSGELRSMRPPPDNAAPEQVAAWRAERGLPESAADYVNGLQLDDGTVAAEPAKAMLVSFAELASNGHWTAQQYNEAVRWYFAMQNQRMAELQHADARFKSEASADLAREWGHDYAVNRSAIAQFLDRSFAANFRDAMLAARLPDGRALANHPEFNKAILEIAKLTDPSGKMLPNASGRALSNVESRIHEIEKRYMRAAHGSDAWKTYWTGEAGSRMQQEYRGLLASREQARRGRAE